MIKQNVHEIIHLYRDMRIDFHSPHLSRAGERQLNTSKREEAINPQIDRAFLCWHAGGADDVVSLRRGIGDKVNDIQGWHPRELVNKY